MKNILVAMLCLFVSVSQANAADMVWRVIAIDGVAVKSGTIPANKGDTLAPGEWFETDTGSAALLALNGQRIRLAGNARIFLSSEMIDGRTVVVQSGGLVTYQVVDRDDTQFEVRTGDVSTITNNAIFDVSSDQEGHVVRIRTGEVEVKSRDGRPALLRAGNSSAHIRASHTQSHSSY